VVWERYVASWRAEAASEKRALFDRCLAPGCVYTDPITQARGWDALLAYMTEFHRQIPGGHFVTRQFIAHHGRSLARWSMRNAGGEEVGEGASYGEYDGKNGLLVAMTGFFEAPAKRP
jgi:hypothetical protein